MTSNCRDAELLMRNQREFQYHHPCGYLVGFMYLKYWNEYPITERIKLIWSVQAKHRFQLWYFRFWPWPQFSVKRLKMFSIKTWHLKCMWKFAAVFLRQLVVWFGCCLGLTTNIYAIRICNNLFHRKLSWKKCPSSIKCIWFFSPKVSIVR